MYICSSPVGTEVHQSQSCRSHETTPLTFLYNTAVPMMERNENETSDEFRQRMREELSQICSTLTDEEEEWKDKRPLLESRGYRLRSRYQIGWTPSWIGKDVNIERCEDSHQPPVSPLCHFMGRHLCILASPTNRRDSH